MGKPDFIGVGTERAGTSWLFTMIAHHPEIWVPPLKELHFLDTIDPEVPSHNPRYKWHLTSRIKHKAVPFCDMQSRPEFFKNSYAEYLQWDWCYFKGSMDFDWYQGLFDERFVKGRIAGEFTPAYCNIAPELIKRLLDVNPDMKFVMVFRNPVEQMRSSLIQNFVMIEKRRFSDVTDDEMMDWLASPFALRKSNIRDVLEKWREIVPHEQLCVGVYDEIREEPFELIKRVYAFLGLSDDFTPEKTVYKRKINKLTKRDTVIPQNVQDYIDGAFGVKSSSDTKYLLEHYPEFKRYWDKD